MKLSNSTRRAVTLMEIIMVAGLFVLLMLVVYRLFFAEVRTIKTALEHIGVNESARRFFAYFGNDIRNASWVEYPVQTNRQTVDKLMYVNEGKILVLRRQVFDFAIKPPAADFLREELIEYQLRKSEDGTSDLYRITTGDIAGSTKPHEKKVCDGVREMLVFTTNRKPVNLKSFAPGLPFKSLIVAEPYELDGSGPYLVHISAAFVRKGDPRDTAERIAHRVRTCFNLRGKLNGVRP
ncbi:MAG TPA: hypothetical protein PLM07_14865 [Candidatus Rifleibacterium sp.]|nr:hypothetical protein [Candidatus Rifleibacterium sp.]